MSAPNRTFVLLALMLATGCGEAEKKKACAGYGCSYDLSTEDGLRFRNHAPLTSYDQAKMEHMIAEPYREVEVCTQVMTGGPLVIAVQTGSLNLPDGSYVGGWTFWEGVIVITDDDVKDGWQTVPYTALHLSVLRHEFVHYLLHASGFPDDLNHSHQSPLFAQCAGL